MVTHANILLQPHFLTRLEVVLDRGLESDWVRANDLGHLLAVLEEHECRHGTDGEFLCDVWDFVYVELVEARVGVLAGESVKFLC